MRRVTCLQYVQQLTQYVTVLRMMQAPKPQVVQKLIAAHTSRARSMVKSFQAMETSIADGLTSLSDKDSNRTVSAGRYRSMIIE